MIAYNVISPIINGFGAMFSIFSYLVYKYLFVWVVNQKPQMDTGGLFFPKAIGHLFVGMYIQEICLAALFFFARDDRGKVSALPQAILTIILIVITVSGYPSIMGSTNLSSWSTGTSSGHMTRCSSPYHCPWRACRMECLQ